MAAQSQAGIVMSYALEPGMYLNRDEYDAVYAAALDAGLADPQRRSLLLAWIPGDVVGALERLAAPAEQLKSDLRRLNGLESAEALITWLKNAAGLVSYLPSKKALFEQTAQRLAKAPKAVTPATPPSTTPSPAPAMPSSTTPSSNTPTSQPARALRIQFFAASPKTFDGLQYGRELRQIHERLERHSARLKVGTIHTGATLRRFAEWLDADTPTIIHLSCHGDDESVALESDDGGADLIENGGMIEMLQNANFTRQYRKEPLVRLLFINACRSHVLAQRVVDEVPDIDFAIGTEGKVTDEAAVAFADEFYSALGGELEVAFRRARTRVRNLKRPHKASASLFTFHVRDGVDPMTVLIPQ